MEKTTSMSCSVNSSVRPRCRVIRSMSRIVSRVSVADIPAVGSSRRSRSGSLASAMPSSSCFWLPCERKPLTSPAFSCSPTDSSTAYVSSRKRLSTRAKKWRPRPRCEMNAACTFSKTVSLGKMLVRWNERPMPRRQTSWGASPVMSRPFRITAPASGRRWPVTRLKNVVLPAPLGPMIAAIWPRATPSVTPATAWKPSKALRTSRTSSMTHPQPGHAGRQRADDAAGKREQDHDQHGPEHERPVLGVRGDLLVQHEQDERAHRGTPEIPHAAEQRHDEHLGRLRPVREVREHAAIEDAEEPTGEPGKDPGDDEGDQLVTPHAHADELGPLGVLADRREQAPERRAHDPPEHPEAQRDQDDRHEIEVVAGPEITEEREPLHPVEIGVGNLGHALLTAGDVVPLEADRPHDLGEGQREHGEVDLGQAHAEEAEHESGQPCPDPGGRKSEHERHAELLHEDAGGVGADPEVGGVTEGDEARVADQEIEADREEAHDGDVGRHERVETGAERGDEKCRHDHERPPRSAGEALDHRSGRPSRPHGRTISTTAMRAKTEKIEKRGKIRMPNESTSPYTMEPRNVPQNEPSPPMTTTMNASTMISTSIPGTIVFTGVTSAPPRPARNDPMTKTPV